MINSFLLYSGNDIPFIEGQLIIHQPTLKEIAFVGEKEFHTGCEILRFSKENLSQEDRTRLTDVSDFDILMSMMTQKNIAFNEQKNYALQVLALMFPDYRISLLKDRFYFIRQKSEDEIETGFIDRENFPIFKKMLGEIFCLQKSLEEEFNPSGEAAAKIAEKLKNRRRYLESLKSGKGEKVSTVYGRYISILSVATQKTVNELFDYTIYQILDEFTRYMLKYNHDIYIQAKMAGATGMKDAEDWTKDIHVEK